MSLNVSISYSFSRRLRFARFRLPPLTVDKVADCSDTLLSWRRNDADVADADADADAVADVASLGAC